MLDNIFKNYEAFYTMLTSTMLMSNTPSGTFVKDCDQIIKFICDSYNLSDEIFQECKNCIYKNLAPIKLVIDKKAVFSNRQFSDTLTDADVLDDIKCDVISTFERIAESKLPYINPDWLDYTHYLSYNAFVRYQEIKLVASGGNVIANRQIGILSALGIGLEKNLKESVDRLIRCALWGDIPSIKILAHVYKLTGDEKNAKIFSQTANLADKYLHSGHTVVSKEDKEKYLEEAVTNYLLTSSILQDVVYAYNKQSIDFSFIEAILSEDLDYYKRMYYINNYERKEWRDVTNSARNPAKKVGFK